ncbi:MAG TPA: phosphatase PAP2 family protein [Pseudolysinimonas sp.]|nr:phosphatase PAP2 family protein [Pseudolysinimonas sp.]
MPRTSSAETAPARVARLWPLVSAATGFLLVGALAAVIVFRGANKPFGFELEWMHEVAEDRGPFWTALALTFNFLGGGIFAFVVVPLSIIIALVITRRPWAALYFGIASLASAGLVDLLKHLVSRTRPDTILVRVDLGSFPSGHSANAALLAATLGIILRRTWVWAAGIVYTVGMMLSRTYLGAHWISDTIGGVLVGAGVAVIVWAPFANKLFREKHG